MNDKPKNLVPDIYKPVYPDTSGHITLKTELRPCEVFGSSGYLFHRWFEEQGELKALTENKENGNITVAPYYSIKFCDRG